MFDGRTLKCQSSKSTEMPSRWEIRPPSARSAPSISCSFSATSATGVLISPVRKYRSRNGARSSESVRSLARDQLEHEQERHDAGVGLREVAEVVVRRDLAGEDGVLLAHAVLDERVTDAVDERRRRRPPRSRGARPSSPGRRRSPSRRAPSRASTRASSAVTKSPGHELARVVDEEAAVGVAVVGDAEVGALRRASSRR